MRDPTTEKWLLKRTVRLKFSLYDRDTLGYGTFPFGTRPVPHFVAYGAGISRIHHMTAWGIYDVSLENLFFSLIKTIMVSHRLPYFLFSLSSELLLEQNIL